jgi:single-strand DNA-binding protein
MTDITLIGNLTAAPEIKFAQSGKAWARFTIVTSDRVHDKEKNTWSDGEPTFWRCVAFGKTAENMADSLDKGARVVALGRVKEESYKAQDGTDRKEMRVTVDEIAVSLKFGPVKAGTPAARPQAAPSDDPWGVPF